MPWRADAAKRALVATFQDPVHRIAQRTGRETRCREGMLIDVGVGVESSPTERGETFHPLDVGSVVHSFQEASLNGGGDDGDQIRGARDKDGADGSMTVWSFRVTVRPLVPVELG